LIDCQLFGGSFLFLLFGLFLFYSPPLTNGQRCTYKFLAKKPRAPGSMQSFAKVFTPGLPPFVSWPASKKKEGNGNGGPGWDLRVLGGKFSASNAA